MKIGIEVNETNFESEVLNSRAFPQWDLSRMLS